MFKNIGRCHGSCLFAFIFLPFVVFCSVKKPASNHLKSDQKSGFSKSDETSTRSKAYEGLLNSEAIRPELIDGTTLQLESQKVSSVVIGDQSVMQISVESEERVDYIEFYACKAQDQTQCFPSKERPESFVLADHWYPSAPAGELEVGFRACARADNLILGSQPCGSWQSVAYTQKENLSSKWKDLLLERYKNESRVRVLGSELLTSVSAYISEASPGQKSLVTLAKNLQVLGEDILSQLLLTDYIFEIKNQLEESQRALALAEKTAPGAVVPYSDGMAILTLGNLGVLSILTEVEFSAVDQGQQGYAKKVSKVKESEKIAKQEIKNSLTRYNQSWYSHPTAAGEVKPRIVKLSGLGSNLLQLFTVRVPKLSQVGTSPEETLLSNLEAVFREVLEIQLILAKIDSQIAP